MELDLTNSALKAIVDDRDYDRVKDRKWFYHKGHVYTNIDMPTNKPGDEPERVKVRLDRYIFELTAHNFINIRHMPHNPLDHTRFALFQEPLKMVAKTEGMTRYLGVTSTKGKIIATYENKKLKIKDKKKEYPMSDNASAVERNAAEERAARQYDEWARYHEGANAKTNFLPKSIYK